MDAAARRRSHRRTEIIVAGLAGVVGCRLDEDAAYVGAALLGVVWLLVTWHFLMGDGRGRGGAGQGESSPENNLLTHWLQGAVVLAGGAFSLTQFTTVTAAEAVQLSFARKENGLPVTVCIDERPGQPKALRVSTTIIATNVGQVRTERLRARAVLQTPYRPESPPCWGAPLDSAASDEVDRLCAKGALAPDETSLGSLSAGTNGSAVFHWWIPIEQRNGGKWAARGGYGLDELDELDESDESAESDTSDASGQNESSMTQELRITVCTQSTACRRQSSGTPSPKDCDQCSTALEDQAGGWTTTVRVDSLNLDLLGACETPTSKALGNCYLDGAPVPGYDATGLTFEGCLEHCDYCVARRPSALGGPRIPADSRAPDACALLWQPREAGAAAVMCPGEASACTGCAQTRVSGTDRMVSRGDEPAAGSD